MSKQDNPSLIGLPWHIVRMIVAAAFGVDRKRIDSVSGLHHSSVPAVLKKYEAEILSVRKTPEQGIAALALLACYDAVEKGLSSVKLLKTADIVDKPADFNALRNALAGFASFKAPALQMPEHKEKLRTRKRGASASTLRNAQDPVETSTISPDSGDTTLDSGDKSAPNSTQVFE